MSEQLYRGFPDTHRLILGIFEDAYKPDSDIGLKNVNASEIIEGTQANGCRIVLWRPAIGMEPVIGGLIFFQVVVNYEVLEGDVRVPNSYERTYSVTDDERRPVTEILNLNPIALIDIGPGESADLHRMIEESDFNCS